MTTKTEQPPLTEAPVVEQETDIQEMVNLPSLVPAFGKTYAIKKFAFGKLCQSFEYVGPIVILIENVLSWPTDKKGKPKPTREQLMTLAIHTLAMAGPSVMGLVSIATQEPLEWLEEQDDSIGGLAIFAKVVEKNLDFFTPENIDRFKDLFAGLQARIPPSVGK